MERKTIKIHFRFTYPYGIYIVNQQYDIEYINPVIEREFGQILDRKCFEYFRCKEYLSVV